MVHTVGDITPREGIPKKEKDRLEAVSDRADCYFFRVLYRAHSLGGNAQLRTRNASQ